MSVKKKVVDFAESQLVMWIARIIYFAGLAVLIPLFPVILSPTQLGNVRTAFVTALFLIALSFILLLTFTKSRSRALFSMGLMTIIPGFLAVLFSAFGERTLVEFLVRRKDITPLVQNYLDSYVPHTWFLAGIYIIAGVLLMWSSYRVRK